MNGVNPVLALILSTIAGFIAGFVTGLLHTKCQIPAILAGISDTNLVYIPSTCESWAVPIHLYYSMIIIFEGLENLTGLSNNWIVLIIGLIVTVLVILIYIGILEQRLAPAFVRPEIMNRWYVP